MDMPDNQTINKVVEHFVLRRDDELKCTPLRSVSGQAGPILEVLTESEGWFRLAAWVAHDVYLLHLWNAKEQLEYHEFMTCDRIHEHLQRRLCKLKVDWDTAKPGTPFDAWDRPLSDRWLAEYAMERAMKGI